MGFKIVFYMLYQGLKHIVNNISCLKAGQTTNYAILQNAHRLEKGLCIRNPRRLWGYDKANELVSLINKEANCLHPDSFALETGTSVLCAYIKSKELLGDDEEQEKLQKLKKHIVESGVDITCKVEFGGAMLVKREELLQNESLYSVLFKTRHSARDFSDVPVDSKKLEKAIDLALRAPSACNRQATQVYVISGEDRIKAGSSNEYHADKYLIITGNMRAFVMAELNDWIVSTSIFCGYLSLALHAEGIGSCFFRKEIISESIYNNNVRVICNIPDDEQIILEMAIGNYKDEFVVPVSRRRSVKEILHYS